MANFIGRVELPNQVAYELHDSEFIEDTRSSGGSNLTGVSKAPSLFDGMQITFWMNYSADVNVTLNLTLSGGNKTGAIPCYYSGSKRLSTEYPAGSAIRFIYRESAVIDGVNVGRGWWADASPSDALEWEVFGS